MKNEVVGKDLATYLVSQNEFIEPPLFQVVVHNDDFTPMEFVVAMLEKFFHKERRAAIDIMLQAHMKGKAMCGHFTKDIAASKIAQVLDYARLHEHPLVCSMETA